MRGSGSTSCHTPNRGKTEPGWVEVGALIMLLVGGLVLPVIGWVIGIVLLWTSNVWNVRDKVIGTIFFPGGLGLPVLLARCHLRV